MKRFYTIIALLLTVMIFLCGCQPNSTGDKTAKTSETATQTTEAAETTESDISEEKSTPLFWKVSGNGFDGEFYLLGSIHIGDDQTNNYPQEIMNAYNACDYVAVESDVIRLESDIEAAMKSLSPFIYQDGSTISDHIDAELYDAAVNKLKEFKLYNSYLDYYNPAMWWMLIDQLITTSVDGYDTNKGVDRFFLQLAKDEEKEIIEIEDYMDTYSTIAGLSAETQQFLLKECVKEEYSTEAEEDLRKLYGMWKAGDEKALTEELITNELEDIADEDLAYYEEYDKAILVDRNISMVNAADQYLKENKNVFYIVGLAHMLDDDGIVQQLRELGYTVTRVTYK